MEQVETYAVETGFDDTFLSNMSKEAYVKYTNMKAQLELQREKTAELQETIKQLQESIEASVSIQRSGNSWHALDSYHVRSKQA